MTIYKLRLIAAAVAIILFSASAFAQEKQAEKIVLPQLGAEVSVRYDKYGIPSISAESIHDLFFAQGYIHARDRLWQMDVTRRQTTGRMAELFGKGRVGEDYNTHIAQLPEVAKKISEQCKPVECEVYQAYTDGVNAYIAGLKEYPEEYKKLNAAPAPWEPIDSYAIGRGMSWVLSSDLGIEVAVGLISRYIGEQTTMKLLPIEGMDPITIVGNAAKSSFPSDLFDTGVAVLLDQDIYKSTMSIFGPTKGSNNWVVSGSRSASGAPLLSNDTHMGFSSPCDWYEINLKAPGIHATGLSFPGAPGMLVGHNEHIAWGVTQARYDVSDVYIEQLDPDKSATNYMHEDKSIPFEVEKLQIKYKTDDGMEVEERTLLHTMHGPVIYESDRPKSVMSYRWTGHEPTHEGLAFIGFMTAKNLDEFKAALDNFEVGAQNFVYADVEGNIYYRAQGKVPIRKGRPFFPLDGSSGKYEWTGYIPYNELPSLENPKQGFVATANNRIAGKNYPYYIGAFFDKGFRARRISDMILETDKMTVAGMQKIQADVFSSSAKALLPSLLTASKTKMVKLTPEASQALYKLKNWDLYEKKDAVEPSIFYTWVKYCTINTLKDNVPANAFGDIARPEVVFPILTGKTKLPIDLFDDLNTENIETREMIFAKSLNDAVVELAQKYGPDMSGWTWDKMHRVTLGHRLGSEFNVGPFAGDGGTDSINVADFGLTGGDFNFGHGPNMRMTVEMLPDGPRGYNVIAGGASGSRTNQHYSDQMQMWLNYETHPMPFTDKDIENNTESVTILGPK